MYGVSFNLKKVKFKLLTFIHNLDAFEVIFLIKIRGFEI